MTATGKLWTVKKGRKMLCFVANIYLSYSHLLICDGVGNHIRGHMRITLCYEFLMT
jgi:hypothetical protein